MTQKHRQQTLAICTKTALTVLWLSVATSLSTAATTADQIEQAAAQFMAAYIAERAGQLGEQARLDYIVNPVDPRLSMADCEQPLSVQSREAISSGRLNLLVSCASDTPWSLYVPVELKLYRPVVVALTPLGRGSVISASDLILREMDTAELRGAYFTQIDDVVGMQVKRNLAADAAVSQYQIEPPLVVARGDEVILSAVSGSLSVKTSAIALSDGRIGEQIRVRNRSSKRLVDARVTGAGQVQAAM